MLITILNACAEQPAPRLHRHQVLSAPLAVLETPFSQGVVLPEALEPEVLSQCSRRTPPDPDGYWQPPDQDIQLLEQMLPAYLETRPEAVAVRGKLREYRRQYAGLLRGGRKTIYINLFLPEYGLEWRDRAVVVCDGGDSFWGVEFDPTTRTFTHIAYNGIA